MHQMLQTHIIIFSDIPYPDALIYLIKCSQIDAAIDNPAPVPLWDKMHEAENCAYVNYSKLPSIFLHLYSNKAMCVR